MRAYKCSAPRLARFFNESRDKWKERAAKYHKKLRALQVKLRDLLKSREHWKERALEAEAECRQIEEKYDTLLSETGLKRGDKVDFIEPVKKPPVEMAENVIEGEFIPHNNIFSMPEEAAMQVPYGHMYPLFIIQLSINQIINSNSSLRGCQQSLKSFSAFFDIPVPSFTTIHNWVFRLGLYRIQNCIEMRKDWIYFIDLTVELGIAKVLLILGIPEQDLPVITISPAGAPMSGYNISHNNVDVLAIEVIENSTGDRIFECLESVSQKYGYPLQIISDHGSDIHAGINKFKEIHPTTISTYDITHKMALLLKHELKDDEHFRSFMGKSTVAQRKTQQTALNCIKPPRQRTKSRYHNIDTHIAWAQNIIDYQENCDFSDFGTEFIFDSKTFDVLWEVLNDNSHRALCRIPWKHYSTRAEFVDIILSTIGTDKISEDIIYLICQVADRGRRRFMGSFGWVFKYQEDIEIYSQFIDIVKIVETQVKYQGLNQDSRTVFEKTIQGKVFLPRAQNFKDNVIAYLDEEGNNIPKGKTLPGNSDLLSQLLENISHFLASVRFTKLER